MNNYPLERKRRNSDCGVKGQACDAGRIENGYAHEKNDCTVRAYAVAAEIDYKVAHVELFLAGRKVKKGFVVEKFYTEKFGKPMGRPNMSVGKFVSLIAGSGNWIIKIRGHVFAVKEGVIYDINPAWNLNRHVLMAWKVK